MQGRRLDVARPLPVGYAALLVGLCVLPALVAGTESDEPGREDAPD